MNDYKYDIDLIDLLTVLWKRKWFIIIPTLIVVILTGIYSFLQPRIWEVDTLVSPCKILIQSVDGKFEEYVFNDSIQYAEQINRGSFNNSIAAELELDINKFPKIRAENIKETNLIRISLKEKNIERAKSILHSLFNHLKQELDLKSEIEQRTTERAIETLEKQLNIVKKRIDEIEKEMNTTMKRIELLESEQRTNLEKKDRIGSESLGMLLYSNEIQQRLRYYDELKELLSDKKLEEENIILKVSTEKGKINRIESTRLVKNPAPSGTPVSPRKKLNILIASILSLAIFTMLALFIENLKRRKKILSNSSS